jgi:hypothetical protein
MPMVAHIAGTLTRSLSAGGRFALLPGPRATAHAALLRGQYQEPGYRNTSKYSTAVKSVGSEELDSTPS